MQYEVTPASKDGESDCGPPPWIALRRRGVAARFFWRHRGGVLSSACFSFSSAVTPLLTLTQLYLDYRRDVGAIDLRMSEIDSGYRQSLGERLWRLDQRQLQLQVDGIGRMPDISYVELREATDGAEPVVVRAGSHRENPPVRREFRIFYTNHDTEQLVGISWSKPRSTRSIVAFWNTAAVILISQGIRTFFVSFFILLISTG